MRRARGYSCQRRLQPDEVGRSRKFAVHTTTTLRSTFTTHNVQGRGAYAMIAGYIRGFDGLRAISIILVVLTHLGVHEDLPEQQFIRDRLWGLFSGATGVNIFFTISGFLITRSLIAEKLRDGTVDLKKFYLRRFLRLTPPFVLFMIINIFLVLLGCFKIPISAFLISFLYLYNFIPTTMYNGHLGHTWSLAVEEQFYLLWPFVIKKVSKKSIYLIIFTIILVSYMIAITLNDIIIPGTRTGIKLNDAFHGSRLFIPAVGPIMVGSFFALVHDRNKLVSKMWIWFAPILYAFPLWSPVSLIEASPIIQSMGTAITLTWILLHQQAQIISALEWPPLAYVGRISYGIYLYHVIFMGTSRGSGLIAGYPWNVIVSILFAILSYELMERPLLRWKDRFR